jgi:hypothetical protein
MKQSEAPIKQPFVKRDFSPKKVLPIRKAELINLIINLKSNYAGSIYSNIFIREQLRHLLKGTKSWSGDVLFFFEKTCSLLTASPSHVRSYYGLSKNEDFSF